MNDIQVTIVADINGDAIYLSHSQEWTELLRVGPYSFELSRIVSLIHLTPVLK